MSKSFTSNLTPSPENNRRPRFRVFSKGGKIWMITAQRLTVDESPALQKQISRGVVAVLVHDVVELVKPFKPKTP